MLWFLASCFRGSFCWLCCRGHRRRCRGCRCSRRTAPCPPSSGGTTGSYGRSPTVSHRHHHHRRHRRATTTTTTTTRESSRRRRWGGTCCAVIRCRGMRQLVDGCGIFGRRGSRVGPLVGVCRAALLLLRRRFGGRRIGSWSRSRCTRCCCTARTPWGIDGKQQLGCCCWSSGGGRQSI